jgi:signal transduction histidine kinase
LDKIENSIQSWMHFIHPDDFDRVIQNIYDAINQGKFYWSAEYRFRRQDGSYASVLDRGQIIRDKAGKAVRMIGGMTDITDRLALEEQLRQSQRLESLGQLTGGVAHDFNNLLTIILGNAELLTEQLRFNPKLHELAEMINGAALKGAELTKRLLAFARRQALEPKIIDINSLLENMITLLQHTLGEHINIIFKKEDLLKPVTIDPGQLENAILNLAINARDAMPEGGQLVLQTKQAILDTDYAKTHAEVKPGSYIQISVTDTGAGIAAKDLKKVFEPFFSTKSKDNGTGLGLSMVFGFMKQSGGHINIYSEVGKGTSVHLYLPQKDTGKPEENMPQPVKMNLSERE